MEFSHIPVLWEETINMLNIKPDGCYADGTLGGGGHAKAICERLSRNGILIGIDRDKDSLSVAEKQLSEFRNKKYFIQRNYEDIKEILADLDIEGLDGAVLDLGVSSLQLDNPDRGFSYMRDEVLDMRMNTADELTARFVVNKYEKEKLTQVIREYGEEKWASRIAAFIVRERCKGHIETTGQLVEIIKMAIPAAARREGPHPAKRTFQAIRIEVNNELRQLERALDRFMDVLLPKGRLCVITFHSLEDRIVKNAYKERLFPCICPREFPVCTCGRLTDVKKVTGKPVLPGKQELEENPRSRSAKLRTIEKR